MVAAVVNRWGERCNGMGCRLLPTRVSTFPQLAIFSPVISGFDQRLQRLISLLHSAFAREPQSRRERVILNRLFRTPPRFTWAPKASASKNSQIRLYKYKIRVPQLKDRAHVHGLRSRRRSWTTGALDKPGKHHDVGIERDPSQTNMVHSGYNCRRGLS